MQSFLTNLLNRSHVVLTVLVSEWPISIPFAVWIVIRNRKLRYFSVRMRFWRSTGIVRSDHPFTKRFGDMLYNSWLD